MTTSSPWDWNKLTGVVASLAEPDAPPAGRLGKYRLLRELGRGAMGIVYEAEDPELQRLVAVKVLRSLPDAKETLRLRFQREALSAAKLDHPNVIRVFDSGEADDRSYIVMERIEGRPLSDLLGGRKTEMRPLLLILEKSARGLAAAHRAGIVHRDVKPANILVTDEGEPKVGDFGLAHRMDADTVLTKTGAALGTPMYMSPEQVSGRGGDITPATDVYALGCILYEILTGRPPHTGTHMAEIYSKIVGDDPLSPRRLNTRVPTDLETICLKALEKDAARRYADAAEFADDLRRHLDGESILARPMGGLTMTTRWIRRHRTLSMAAAFAAGTLFVISVHAASVRKGRQDTIEAQLKRGRDARRAGVDLRGRLDELVARERELSASIAPTAEPELKKPLWEIRQRERETQARLSMLAADALSAFTSVLAIDPASADARRALAEFYFEALEEAERKGDAAAAESQLRLVRIYDDGTLAPKLQMQGTVDVDSVPSGAEVELFEYREGPDRRLAAVASRRLGKCPIAKSVLPAGSWLLILRQPGFRDTRCPVLVTRASAQSLKVNLYRDDEIGAGFVYVPGGPFIQGADPEARNGAARHDTNVGDFFIGRDELSVTDYIAFLNSLLQERGVAEAQRRAPRKAAGQPLWQIPPGAAELPVPDNVPPRWPVQGISWADAHAYCEWRTRKEGGRATYRLPTSAEWEKAARGVDGRFHVWGDTFDWSFANGAKSWPDETRPNTRASGATPADESVYGVVDMAGNLEEWCEDWIDERQGIKHKRGGAFGVSLPTDFRCANQSGAGTALVNVFYGFRLVKLPKKDF